MHAQAMQLLQNQRGCFLPYLLSFGEACSWQIPWEDVLWKKHTQGLDGISWPGSTSRASLLHSLLSLYWCVGLGFHIIDHGS